MSEKRQKTTGHRMFRGLRGRSSGFVAVGAAAVVVLAIAGVLRASGGAGLGLGAAVPPTLVPANATTTAILAEKATLAAQSTMQAATTQAQPTPTYPTGIFQTHQSPVGNSTFSVMTEYEGPLGGQWVFVFAGTAWANFPNTGVGALMVYTSDKGHIGTFDAPDHSKWLNITAINGTVLQLRSDKSGSLTFDLATDTFGS